MTWQNYGKVWHVDHKKPLRGKLFDLTNSLDCQIAFHWTNLQPLFARENLKKSSKIIDQQQSAVRDILNKEIARQLA
jgi:uncharacterized protein YycO